MVNSIGGGGIVLVVMFYIFVVDVVFVDGCVIVFL